MRRGRSAIVGGIAALLAVAWLGGPCAPTGAPSMDAVETFAPGDVVVWDPNARLVVFELGGRLVVDRLVIDRSPYLELPMPPRWRVTGREWFSIALPAAGAGGIVPISTGGARVFGRWPADLDGRVAGVVLETSGGAAELVTAAVSERGFLVTAREAIGAGEVGLLDAAGGRIGSVLLRPADG